MTYRDTQVSVRRPNGYPQQKGAAPYRLASSKTPQPNSSLCNDLSLHLCLVPSGAGCQTQRNLLDIPAKTIAPGNRAHDIDELPASSKETE